MFTISVPDNSGRHGGVGLIATVEHEVCASDDVDIVIANHSDLWLVLHIHCVRG